MIYSKKTLKGLSIQELEKLLTEGTLPPGAIDICKDIINEKSGKQIYRDEPVSASQSSANKELYPYESENDYKTSISIAQFISFIGWLMCICALILVITTFSEAGRMGVLVLASGLGVFIGGLILVIAGQTSRAVMDNTNYSRQMVDLMKKIA